MGAMADELFICYAHLDAGQVLPRLEWLEGAGYTPWFDQHITSGSVWRDTISDAIERAEVAHPGGILHDPEEPGEPPAAA